MLFNKFGRLALSFLLGVTPTSFRVASDPLTFPLTRTDSIQYKISFDASDLGKINENSENHIYLVTEHVDISCSSACSLANVSFAYAQPFESQIEFDLSYKTDALTPNEFKNTLTSLNSTQAFSEAHTYNSEASSFIWRLNLPTYGGGSWTLAVFFPAVNDGLIQRSTNFLVDEFSNLYFGKEYLINAVSNKNYPSSVMSEYVRLINNGQYAEAVTYITNYNVSNMENNNNSVNNSVDSLNNENTSFSTQSNALIEFENLQKQNFNSQLQNVDFVFNGNQFEQSASFYKKVFTDFVAVTPLFKPISVALIFALAMIILGHF